MIKRAKIVATLGPASHSPEIIEAMLAAGVNGIRINMSHGTHAEHAEQIALARAAAAKTDRPLAILVDLCGPKIRTGKLKGGVPVQLKANSLFTITTRETLGDTGEVSTNYDRMPQDVKTGSRLLIDDGLIELIVESITETDIACRVINGGMLGERKGINLPGINLPIPSLTEKDRVDLVFAVEHKADYIALSFVRSAADCIEAKELIKAAGGRQPLIAKIEKAEAIEHLDDIIAIADGLMVARGDLGVETSVELVPVYQKQIIDKANTAGKLVITATQMLQSMIENPRPTRAEASDVANAVWDGTDAVMLSGETASGSYPVAAVATMARIIESAESGRKQPELQLHRWIGKQSGRTSRALCEAAAFAADEMGTRTTAVFTESGLMARRLSALRPDQRIVALSGSPEVRNGLAIVWGIEPLLHPKSSSTEDMLSSGERTLIAAGVVELGETLVIMAGRMSGLGLSSSVTLYTIGGEVPQQTPH